jgi:hypothetical protein
VNLTKYWLACGLTAKGEQNEKDLPIPYNFSTTCCLNSLPLLFEFPWHTTRLLECSLAVSSGNTMSLGQKLPEL